MQVLAALYSLVPFKQELSIAKSVFDSYKVKVRQSVLAQKCGCSVSTIKRTVEELIRKGYIEAKIRCEYIKDNTVDDISSFFSVAFCFIVMYSAITLIAWFSKAVGNWIIGIILFFVCIIGVGMVNMPKALDLISGLAVSFCGVIVDISRIVKLIRLSAKPKEALAEQQPVPVVVVNTVQEKD